MPCAFEGLQVQVLLPKRQPEGRARDRLVEHQHGYETRQQKMEPSRGLTNQVQLYDTLARGPPSWAVDGLVGHTYLTPKGGPITKVSTYSGTVPRPVQQIANAKARRHAVILLTRAGTLYGPKC